MGHHSLGISFIAILMLMQIRYPSKAMSKPITKSMTSTPPHLILGCRFSDNIWQPSLVGCYRCWTYNFVHLLVGEALILHSLGISLSGVQALYLYG